MVDRTVASLAGEHCWRPIRYLQIDGCLSQRGDVGMDRRKFISTVGAASAVAGASTALSEDAARAEPPAGPAELPPEHVDNRFLDTLTKVNDLQIPTTLSSYQEQIDSLSSPRTLAQSALRLVSAYVNPRGQNHHSSALLGPL